MISPAAGRPTLPGWGGRLRAAARRLWAVDAVRFAVLTLYYLGIAVALVALYGPGHAVTPPFIYQGF
jgi:hypothetical protein